MSNPRSEAKAEAVESASPRSSNEADKKLGGGTSKK